MTRLWFLLALAACNDAMSGDQFPVSPGNPVGMGTMLDAAVPIDVLPGDGGLTITGRVCLVNDLRVFNCAASGAGGITVTLGTQTAITTDSGAFVIPTPAASNLVWRASAIDLVSSVVAFGPSATIPVIGIEDFLEIQLANSVVLQSGQGSIVTRVVRGGSLVPGAVAQTAPAAQFPTKYDGITSTAWTELATGNAATAWIPGVPVGSALLSVTPVSGLGASETVRVEDQAITFETVELL